MPENYSEKNKQYVVGVKNQRAKWIKFSLVFSFLLVVLGIEWDRLLTINNPVLWGGLGLILIPTAMFWWYWTMKIINFFLTQRVKEVEILEEIIIDIRLIRKDVEELKNDKPRS
jgi:hypothetical protein